MPKSTGLDRNGPWGRRTSGAAVKGPPGSGGQGRVWASSGLGSCLQSRHAWACRPRGTPCPDPARHILWPLSAPVSRGSPGPWEGLPLWIVWGASHAVGRGAFWAPWHRVSGAGPTGPAAAGAARHVRPLKCVRAELGALQRPGRSGPFLQAPPGHWPWPHSGERLH